MATLFDSWIAIQDFLEAGGDVLLVIMAVTFLMWTLILERLWYIRTGHPREVERVMAEWERRDDRSSWYANQIRRALVSQVNWRLNATVPMIQAMVALCPLLGLLGTVTGMIEVFDVMAVTGSSNARAMASGVTHATIPTMAGMVAALSGLYFSFRLQEYVQSETGRVNAQMATK